MQVKIAIAVCRCCLVAAALALGAASAAAQPIQLAQEPQVEPTPPPPRPQQNPGLIEEIRRLWERGTATLADPFGGARQSIDEINRNAANTGKNIGDAAAEVGKTAAGVVVAPLNTRLVSGRERCGLAPNGAPDCNTAANALCKKHGFTTGKSVDFTSAEQCSPTVLLSGRQNAPACTTVTFISRAICQ